MVILRKRFEEPVEGVIIATYVPKAIFTNFDDFSELKKSIRALDEIVIKFSKRLPYRYRREFKKKEEEDFMIIYDNMNKTNGTRSKDLSLTGKLQQIGQMPEEVRVEPEGRKVWVAYLEVGFNYACYNHLVTLLDLFEEYFVFLSDAKTFQPIIRRIKMEDENFDDGNMALYLAYGKPKEMALRL